MKQARLVAARTRPRSRPRFARSPWRITIKTMTEAGLEVEVQTLRKGIDDIRLLRSTDARVSRPATQP